MTVGAAIRSSAIQVGRGGDSPLAHLRLPQKVVCGIDAALEGRAHLYIGQYWQYRP